MANLFFALVYILSSLLGDSFYIHPSIHPSIHLSTHHSFIHHSGGTCLKPACFMLGTHICFYSYPLFEVSEQPHIMVIGHTIQRREAKAQRWEVTCQSSMAFGGRTGTLSLLLLQQSTRSGMTGKQASLKAPTPDPRGPPCALCRKGTQPREAARSSICYP